jgi:hypothetical protein
MANFPRVKPLGWSLFDILASALMNQLDIDHSKSVNGDDGGTWGGPVIFTNATLSGTSTVNTSGDITTSGTILAPTINGNTITASLDLVAGDSLKAFTVMGNKTQPQAVFTASYDVNATLGVVGALDFTANDTFDLTLTDGSGAGTVAQLGSLTIAACTNANTDKEVKKGAKIVIRIHTTQPAGAQTTDGATWPASFAFASQADKAINLLPGQFSYYELELEQVGTPAAPSFLASVRRW